MTHLSIRPGFSLVETVIASIIVGGVLVSSLNVIGAAAKAGNRLRNTDQANLLAHDLMSEILAQPYADPESGVGATLGPEPGETTGSRIQFDDIDDYQGWNAAPLQYANGTLIPGFSNWRRSVTCRRAIPQTLDTSVADTGVLEITVRVRHDGTTVATAVALRTSSWIDP